MPGRIAIRVAGQFLLRFLLVFVTLVALGAALVILQLRTEVDPPSVIAIGLVTGSIILALAVWLAVRFFARPLGGVIERIGALADGAVDPDRRLSQALRADTFATSAWSPFHDVFEELDRLAEALESGSEAREQLQREREHWMAGVSHDLKTPLTAIRGYAELLANRSVPPEEVRRQAGAVVSRSLDMERLLADLELTLRMRAGALEVPEEPLDLVSLVRDVVSEVAADPRSIGHPLSFEASRRPVMVRGDAGLLRRATVNLIVNAVIHNPEGTTVAASVFDVDGAARIEIADDGVGMDAGELETLFERYSSSARSGGSAGSGLGMSVSRQLVQAHGGQLGVESEPGIGTRVVIRLPLAAMRPGPVAAHPATAGHVS